MSVLDAFHRPALGHLLLRISLAVLMVFHGWSKVVNGVSGIEGALQAAGLPGFVAYGVYLGELVAPLLLLAGVLVVPAALAVAVNMLFAIGLRHADQLLDFGRSGGLALELQYFFLVTAIVVAMTAPRTRGWLR